MKRFSFVLALALCLATLTAPVQAGCFHGHVGHAAVVHTAFFTPTVAVVPAVTVAPVAIAPPVVSAPAVAAVPAVAPAVIAPAVVPAVVATPAVIATPFIATTFVHGHGFHGHVGTVRHVGVGGRGKVVIRVRGRR